MKITIETDGIAGRAGVKTSFEVDETEQRFEGLLSVVCDWLIDAGVPAQEVYDGLVGSDSDPVLGDVFLEGPKNAGLIPPPNHWLN